jgi:hypothetical protein
MRFAKSFPIWPSKNLTVYAIIFFAIGGRAATDLPSTLVNNRARNAVRTWFGTLLALLLWHASAEAHGEAEWIRKMQLGCCGPADCVRVPDGTWIRQGGGYLHTVTGEYITDANAKASIDEHYWECRSDNGKVRPVIAREGGMCLFVPAIGF